MIADSEHLPTQQGPAAAQLWQIDQICDGFETAWRLARRPQIEEFLELMTGPGRHLLLCELVELDVHYRRRHGESPVIGDYQQRFPELAGSCPEAALTSDRLDDIAGRGALGELTAHPRANPDSSVTSGHNGHAKTIGKFHLLERVGVGEFGIVWRALDVSLNRTVALKIPHAHLVETPEVVARFYAEARAAAQLRHPGIVTVHEISEHDGLRILVCDFVSGMSLRDLLSTRRLSRESAAKLVAKVADALAYAHSMGAIHRDIKPANIMLDTARRSRARSPMTRAQDGRVNQGSSISAWRSSSRRRFI